MTTPVRLIVAQAVAQAGDDYVFGAETTPLDVNPTEFDCSELVQWACMTVDPVLDPPMVDGSWLQWQHCRDQGSLVGVAVAVVIEGALLFRFSSDPASRRRPDSAHVAFSLGNGSTFEARSRSYGIGSWTSAPAVRGWTHAALIPGALYEPPVGLVIPQELLRYGSRGPTVTLLQQKLNVWLAPALRLDTDGIFGTLTRNAVRLFQASRPDLDVDGIVGPLTWAALG